MSKNLIRKGLALGTALSFVLAGLSAAPATADDAGLVTLMPSAGKTFNSLSGADHGIDLIATVDADISESSAGKLAYLVTNPNRIALTFKVTTNGSTVQSSTVTRVTGGIADTSNQSTTSLATATATRSDAVMVITATTGVASRTEYLTITAAKEAAITVQSFIDKDADGAVDTGEYASKTEAVNLYDAKNVSVSVNLNAELATNVSQTVARLTFSKSVNVDQINLGFFGVAVYEDGVNRDLGATSLAVDRSVVAAAGASVSEKYTLGADLARLGVGANATDSVGRVTGNIDLVATTVVGRNYSARVAYLGHASNNYAAGTSLDLTKVVWAGNRSSAVYIPDGTDAFVSSLATTIADTTNTAETSSATQYVVRTGVKAVKYSIQALSGSVDHESSNVSVKAVLTAGTLATGSKLSISGSTESLGKSGESVAVFGRTDSDGKFEVSVTNSGALVADVYTVDFYYLNASTDLYTKVVSATRRATYETAAAKDFKVVKKVLAGATVNAEFKVLDQFGQGISKDADGVALSVYLADSDTTKLEKTAAVSGGKATISFTNYLAKGDSSILSTHLFAGSDSDTTATLLDGGTNDTEATLYNPEATGSVIVDSTATESITYQDFVTGDPTLDSDADTVALDNADESQLTYKGRVQDTNGAGLPAAVVTITGKGLQFEDFTSGAASGEFFKDSITVVADDSGDFTVYVWNHKVGKTTITATSGGKSGSTVLTGEFNTSGAGLNTTTSGTDRVKIKWNAPKHPAVNGTYVVTATVSDKWGNLLKGAKVDFATDGALTVNGLDYKQRTTNASGKATVYLGTVKDVKGFGSVSATVVSVAVDRDANGTVDVASAAIDKEENLTVTSDLVIGADATAAASKTAGLVKVTAYNATGKTVQVYVSGKLVATKKATSASYSFNVKAAKGTKTVSVKVAGSTYFSGAILIK